MVERRLGIGQGRDIALNPKESKQKHNDTTLRKANVAVVNKEKAVVKQKWGRDKWITYVGTFMQHRNLMIGIWNGLAKRNEDWDTEREIEDMFKVEGLDDLPIDGKSTLCMYMS